MVIGFALVWIEEERLRGGLDDSIKAVADGLLVL